MPLRFVIYAALMMSAAFSCSPTEAPSQPAGSVESSATPSSPAPATISKDQRAAQSFLVAAKKLVMSERAVASNVSSYESDVRKQLRINEGTGLTDHIPSKPLDVAAIKAQLTKVAKEAKLEVSELTIGAPVSLSAVPRVHRGKAPFAYKREHLWRHHPTRLVVSGATDKSLKRFYREHLHAHMPLFVVESKQVRGPDVVLEGAFFDAPSITPPVHQLEPVTLKTFAKRANVEVPTSGPEREAAEALLKQYDDTLRPQLAKAREALGRTHLAGTHFALYRALTERISGDPFGERRKQR